MTIISIVVGSPRSAARSYGHDGGVVVVVVGRTGGFLYSSKRIQGMTATRITTNDG